MKYKIIEYILENVQGDMEYLQEIINYLQKIVDNKNIKECD